MQCCYFPCCQNVQNPQWNSFRNKLLIGSAVGTILALGLILAGATGLFGAHASIVFIEIGAIILTTTIIAPSILLCIHPKDIEQDLIVMAEIEEPLDLSNESVLKEQIRKLFTHPEELSKLADQAAKVGIESAKFEDLKMEVQAEALSSD